MLATRVNDPSNCSPLILSRNRFCCMGSQYPLISRFNRKKFGDRIGFPEYDSKLRNYGGFE